MKKSSLYFVQFCILVTLISLCSFTVFAQSSTTYKVVCDKTDNTIKVVESTNRAAKYVPLKGGFPFRQIAEQWIAENHPTRTCNAQQDVTPPTQQPQPTTSSTPPPPPPSNSTPPPPINYRNSSLILHGKFSNLGEALYLSSETVGGIELGFEQLFGTKGYFGTGISANFFFADMDTWQGVDSETLYFFRVPVFGGYRIQKRMFVAMFEAGGGLNTGLKATENELDDYGLPAEDFSINFMIRAKVGFPGIMLEAGYDTWLGDVFVDEDFSMSAFRFGIRVSF